MLVGLLTGHAHAHLNLQSTLKKVRSDLICPVCQEEEETALHLLG